MVVGDVPGSAGRAVAGDDATRQTGPPAVPGPGELSRSTLTAIAAIANAPANEPTWTTVTASGRTTRPDRTSDQDRSAVAWRELLDRSGARRFEILVQGIPVLNLNLDPEPERVTVGLVVPGIEHDVDVSIQPGTAVHALEQASREAGIDHDIVESATRDALDAATRHTTGWVPPRSLPLTAVFGGVSFPLLAATYDIGASPVTTIPRWVEPILRAPTISRAAVTAFGTVATRPVRRALVEALRPDDDGHVDFAILALALIGRRVLQPDRIARVLAGDRAVHPQSDLPDRYTLEQATLTVGQWGDQRCERILIDAVKRSDGMRMLLDTIRYSIQLGADGPRDRLPNRLSELHDVYRVLMHSAPAPTRTTPVTPTHAPPGRPRDDHRLDRPVFPHPVLPARNDAIAPGTTRLHPSTGIEHPRAVQSLDGLQVGELRFVVPRTVGDLTRWGSILSNCLGDFARHVIVGTCSIIGVERRRRLTYAVEVTDQGVIRQFNGRANRVPAIDDRAPVIRVLLDAGVIDPNNAHNVSWLTAVGASGQRTEPVDG